MEATSQRRVRLLTTAQATSAVGDGSFYVTSALFLTHILGLDPARAGLWLSLAWGAGFVLSTPIGKLADAVGLRGSAVGLSILVAAPLVAMPLMRDEVTFLVLLVVYAVAQSGLIGVRQAVVSVAVPAAERVVVRARLQVAVNAGIGVGAALGGVALAIGTPWAFAAVLWGDALGFAVAAMLLVHLRLPVDRSDSRASMPPSGPSPARGGVFRDRRYLAAATLSAVLYLYMPMLSVLLPLFLAGRTAAPTWALAAVFVLNTAGVIALQVKAARVVTSITGAARATGRGGLALGAAALLFGLAAIPQSPNAALAVVLTAAAVQVLGEVLVGAGSWYIGFALADPERPAQWQGLFSSGLPLARAVGPVVLIALVLTWSAPGWVILAIVFAAAGLAMGPVVTHADRDRSTTTPTAPLATQPMTTALST